MGDTKGNQRVLIECGVQRPDVQAWDDLDRRVVLHQRRVQGERGALLRLHLYQHTNSLTHLLTHSLTQPLNHSFSPYHWYLGGFGTVLCTISPVSDVTQQQAFNEDRIFWDSAGHSMKQPATGAMSGRNIIQDVAVVV